MTTALASLPQPVKGTTLIQDIVVAKLAGLAIRGVPGVHQLKPWGAAQGLTRLARKIRGDHMRELGVNVEVGQLECAVEVRIVAEYGESIPRIAEDIRVAVSEAVGAATGLRAKVIDIEVADLHFPTPERAAPAARVR